MSTTLAPTTLEEELYPSRADDIEGRLSTYRAGQVAR